ncbi:hypothetical protein M8C21_009955 [Ambrosia artemisiifolia]|uniref:Uncharacterized protein n=1 Tax=Ambrosia artemisiifolia TaxID=4212 RepID=A0AAD5GQ10_AMBAR|nr:hypothetical protein M8C21_009955 [Ambrosia artemisiifolia]
MSESEEVLHRKREIRRPRKGLSQCFDVCSDEKKMNTWKSHK